MESHSTYLLPQSPGKPNLLEKANLAGLSRYFYSFFHIYRFGLLHQGSNQKFDTSSVKYGQKTIKFDIHV